MSALPFQQTSGFVQQTSKLWIERILLAHDTEQATAELQVYDAKGLEHFRNTRRPFEECASWLFPEVKAA
jgi:hypothetical protein